MSVEIGCDGASIVEAEEITPKQALEMLLRASRVLGAIVQVYTGSTGDQAVFVDGMMIYVTPHSEERATTEAHSTAYHVEMKKDLKRVAVETTFHAFGPDGDGGVLEYRTCRGCGSTLGIEHSPALDPTNR